MPLSKLEPLSRWEAKLAAEHLLRDLAKEICELQLLEHQRRHTQKKGIFARVCLRRVKRYLRLVRKRTGRKMVNHYKNTLANYLQAYSPIQSVESQAHTLYVDMAMMVAKEESNKAEPNHLLWYPLDGNHVQWTGGWPFTRQAPSASPAAAHSPASTHRLTERQQLKMALKESLAISAKEEAK